MHRSFPCILACFACWLLHSQATAVGDQPLHQRVDEWIEKKLDGLKLPRSGDAEFLRRVHLDLAGCIPRAEETQRFLENTSADKRRALIDRLLAAPEFPQRMADLFHVMLMEGRGDNDAWGTFLRNSFEKNEPWDRIAQSILDPDADDPKRRGAAYFFTRRLEKVGQQRTDFAGVTRDVGRLFLGVDLQCAECHDHLLIDDYKQREFQGLFVVYRNLSIRQGEFPAVNERPVTAKLEFSSVFEDVKQRTGPRVPFGTEFKIPLPSQPKKKGAKKTDSKGPPAFSAMGVIGEQITSSKNRLFAQNIANRVWYHMMGRGLVEPLDQFHSANQATHPELLQLLVDELVAHHFDLKWLIRELALTATWQRSSRTAAEGKQDSAPYVLARQRRLTADQLFRSVLRATGNLERLTPKQGQKPSQSYTELRDGFFAMFRTEPKTAALDYEPSVKQALFQLNDRNFLGLLATEPENLMHRLGQLPSDKVVDTLYLNVFCRLPDDAERSFVERVLDRSVSANEVGDPKRTKALAQIVWAMLTSLEFCVNH